MDEPLETNFEKRRMKKLMEDRLKKNNSSCDKKTKTYTIEAKYIKIETSTHVSKK